MVYLYQILLDLHMANISYGQVYKNLMKMMALTSDSDPCLLALSAKKATEKNVMINV
jgi:hypothetical protein